MIHFKVGNMHSQADSLEVNIHTYLSIDKLEQGGFSSAIGSHKCHSRFQINTKVNIPIDKGLVGTVLEANMLYHDDRRRNVTTIGKSERDNLYIKKF